MVTKKRSKIIHTTSCRSKSSRHLIALNKGDWLDVMDADGIWNVARVLRVQSADEVEVTYDGWEKEYDEVVCLDSDRVAPYHTFTWAVKCWVKYLNWPLWPAMITIRTPGTEAGIENLGKENRLWVDFFDHSNFLKRDRCWQKKCQVKNFDDHYDENGFGTSGKEFNQSLELMLKSDATTEMPKFTRGTLPVQYKTVTTESVDQKRTSVGGDLWFENFAKNRERHCRMYVYEMIGNVKMKLEEGVSSDKTAGSDKKAQAKKSVVISNSAQTATRKKRLHKEKISPVKTEEEPPVNIEVPYELGEISSSDDSPEEMAGQTKRRRLRLRTRRVISDDSVVPRIPAKNNGHVKGPTKMAARRSTPPFALGCENTDDDERIGSPKEAVEEIVKAGLVKTKTATKSHTSCTGAETQLVELDPDLTPQPSSQPKPSRCAESLLPLIEQRIADAQETLRKLEQEKMVVEKAKQAALSTTGLNPTSASVRFQTAPRVAEEMNVYHLQSEDTERSLLERIAGKDDSKTDGPWKGRIKETAVELREEPVHSVLSESKDPSFNSDESKSTPAALEDGTLTKLPSDNEETKVPGQSIENIRSASTLPRKAMEHNTPRKPHLPAMQDDDSHADNKEDEDLQEVRRHPYCVMQAGQEDDLTSNANKHPKKTVISVPRKFEEALVKQRDVLTASDNLMARIASRPRIAIPSLSIPTGRTGVALASPSTAVFSSSERFSMESWFKRKLYSDFMKR